jgi:hypothetical protein
MHWSTDANPNRRNVMYNKQESARVASAKKVVAVVLEESERQGVVAAAAATKA